MSNNSSSNERRRTDHLLRSTPTTDRPVPVSHRAGTVADLGDADADDIPADFDDKEEAEAAAERVAIEEARELVIGTLHAANRAANDSDARVKRGELRRWYHGYNRNRAPPAPSVIATTGARDAWLSTQGAQTGFRTSASKWKRPLRETQFCFETGLWQRVFRPERCVELLESFRQRDPLFIDLLNHARIGRLTENHLRTLRDINARTQRRLRNETANPPSWLHPEAAPESVPAPDVQEDVGGVGGVRRGVGRLLRDLSVFRVRLFSTRIQVSDHNEAMLSRMGCRCGLRMQKTRT